jgi:hypothetical protein
MEQENQNKIFIDDKEYDLANFNEDQVKYIAQLRDIGIKQSNLKMQYEQLEAAKSVFMTKLKSSLEI